MTFALRTTLYSLVLVLGLGQAVISIFASLFPVIASYMRHFSIASVPVTFATWIMASVMLSYNGKPKSTHPLTRVSSHLLVFSGICFIWTILLIGFATQTPKECNYKEPSDGLADAWCFWGWLLIGFSAGLIVLSGASVVSVYITMKRYGQDLSGNIAAGDKKFKSIESNYAELT